MDDEVKAILREIRDETRRTNERIDELKAWALSEMEKERLQSEKYDEAVYESQKILPKRDIWVLLVMAVIFIGVYLKG